VHIVEALNEPVDNSGSEGAKLFVNMGNVFWVIVFCKASLFLNKYFICFYRNDVPTVIFRLKYESLSLRIR
jgi:hypothetical protein